MENKRIAIVRIRSTIKVKRDIKETLLMLRLFRKNSCVIVRNTPSYIGMLNKVKDYVTWGELTEETFKALLKERGKVVGDKKLTEEYLKTNGKFTYDQFSKEFFNFNKDMKNVPGLKPFFRLKPPIKGFERGGVKTPYSLGGVLGYRKEKINDLIMRML